MAYHIGIELCIPIEELDTIKGRHDDPIDCLTAMLNLWLKSTKPLPTCNALADALKSAPVNEGKIGNEAASLKSEWGKDKRKESGEGLSPNNFGEKIIR